MGKSPHKGLSLGPPPCLDLPPPAPRPWTLQERKSGLLCVAGMTGDPQGTMLLWPQGRGLRRTWPPGLATLGPCLFPSNSAVLAGSCPACACLALQSSVASEADAAALPLPNPGPEQLGDGTAPLPSLPLGHPARAPCPFTLQAGLGPTSRFLPRKHLCPTSLPSRAVLQTSGAGRSQGGRCPWGSPGAPKLPRRTW